VSRRDVLKAAATTPALIGLGFAAGSPCAPSASADGLDDDFIGPAGSPVDSSLWNYQAQGSLTDDKSGVWENANAVLDGNSNLVLTLNAQTIGSTNYTGASINTLDKFAWTSGTVSARVKLQSAGVSPAGVWFAAPWCTGSNYVSVGWPACGEIDIHEVTSSLWSGTFLHGPQGSGSYKLTGPGADFSNPPFPTDGAYHTYWCTRQTGIITTGFDNTTLATWTPASLPAGAIWQYDNFPMDVVLTIMPGPAGQDPSPSVLPYSILVDWVRYTPASS
jgi:beta-glucanase (GH16 family)